MHFLKEKKLLQVRLQSTQTLSKRQESRDRMEEDLKDPKMDPPVAAMSPNATEAALRVVQSLFFRASWMPDIAPDRIFCEGAPPT